MARRKKYRMTDRQLASVNQIVGFIYQECDQKGHFVENNRVEVSHTKDGIVMVYVFPTWNCADHGVGGVFTVTPIGTTVIVGTHKEVGQRIRADEIRDGLRRYGFKKSIQVDLGVQVRHMV